MTRILLDSNILIDVIRGYALTAEQVDQLQESNELVISAITYLELLGGCRNKQSMRSLENLIDNFDVLHVDAVISKRAIDLMKQYYLSHGLLLADALIAATAIENDISLFTRNQKDFQFIDGMVLFRFS